MTPFFICTAPKTGCTAWLSFFLYVNHGILVDSQQVQRNPGMVHSTYQEQKKDSRVSEKNIQFFSQQDKIVIARNPYVRFLSSYMDWKESRAGRDVKTGLSNAQHVSFRDFAMMYQQRNFTPYPVLWNHIDPISKNCGMKTTTTSSNSNEGRNGKTATMIDYNLVLRVEEQTLWYNNFIQRYGLTRHMQTFNNAGNTVFEPALSLDAFVRLKDYVGPMIGTMPWPGTLFNSSHHRGSADKMALYYTPEIADIVTEQFQDDFKQFQYPLWDGRPETFRYV